MRRGIASHHSKRSAAAKKGWETRRRNAEAARRSAAAKKGWETRRQKERQRAAEHAKRSAAAKKGWETRRRREREKAKVAKITSIEQWYQIQEEVQYGADLIDVDYEGAAEGDTEEE